MGNFFDLFRDKTLLPMGGRADTITCSGFSSGSMMSTNLHVINSDIFKGVGLAGGSSYWSPGFFTDEEGYFAEDVDTLV
jgi:hypothetical protein